jgi:hypothetical protein
MSEGRGWICGPRLYEFEGWFFEFGAYGGPWPLCKNGNLRKRAGRKFWQMFTRFMALREDKQEAYRVGGGCQRF